MRDDAEAAGQTAGCDACDVRLHRIDVQWALWRSAPNVFAKGRETGAFWMRAAAG
jgi:hypothetical protein